MARTIIVEVIDFNTFKLQLGYNGKVSEGNGL